MLRALVEVDRATMGPERLAAKISAYERLYRHVPVVVGRPRPGSELPVEEWRRRYPVFPRVLFVLDGTGPTGIDNRISALHAGAKLARADFLRDVPMLAAPPDRRTSRRPLCARLAARDGPGAAGQLDGLFAGLTARPHPSGGEAVAFGPINGPDDVAIGVIGGHRAGKGSTIRLQTLACAFHSLSCPDLERKHESAFRAGMMRLV
ncbi:hypothetical protein MBT84_39010 [Streptomyces sp. MBT84]|nr:hypothetical protein [Streptomyces sp. MBT84]